MKKKPKMDSSNKRKLTDDETAAEQSSKHQKVAEKFDFLNGDTFDLNDDCCRLNCKRLNLDDLVHCLRNFRRESFKALCRCRQ